MLHVSIHPTGLTLAHCFKVHLKVDSHALHLSFRKNWCSVLSTQPLSQLEFAPYSAMTKFHAWASISTEQFQPKSTQSLLYFTNRLVTIILTITKITFNIR